MKRQYTQLDFTRYSPKASLLDQALGLCRDLVEVRRHARPCDCGACVYQEFINGLRGEGRAYSKRTFFMYFLRSSMIEKSVYENRLKNYSVEARIENLDLCEKRNILSGISPLKYTVEVWGDKVLSQARRQTKEMIQGLSRRTGSGKLKEFLNGFLIRKCFYTYYQRAGDPALASIVQNIRKI